MCAGSRLLVALLVASIAGGLPTTVRSQPDEGLIARARAIHDRVVTLDTHNDIDPAHFTATCNYTMRLTTQVDLPKMREGGLDVSFMIVYVAQSNPAQAPDAFQPSGYERAYKAAVEKFEAVRRLTRTIAPDEIELALTPADVLRIAGSRKVAVIGVENGYPIGTDARRVREFFDRGARYMSLAHNGHSQLADSHTGEAGNLWSWGGLSPLGRTVVEEMNRWGIMVDVSHTSRGAAMQAIGLSKAPVIASHSAVRRLADTSRNMDDELLKALQTNGGVIQIVALSAFLRADPRERGPALAKLGQEFGLGAPGAGRGGAPPAPATSRKPECPIARTVPSSAPAPGGRGVGPGLAALSPERRAEYDRRLADLDKRWPAAGRAGVRDLVNHIDYAVKLIGVDHVGISSDFDGGGGIDGWNDVAETFNVTLELVRRGYTEEEIAQLWSGNLLRVWGEVEKTAKRLQAEN
jgi:membrane dipeptidase